ncbi:hypothetical protein Y017_01395 [Alcanivorax sp. 97CO-5]|jgi:uncharacterized alpha-E superfamily protein|uniref:DUF403 domain-containing protein n=1 Tax=Alcanivorax borkumensis (strain ATCC 700651 / DSM 11573 / NCIMB 13689 / SK2) TaxID=393595 RepID=Q0VQJ3_ALCBS|nr:MULTISPECIES: alpha-E domain-containing protein [Alcanivorax]EUC71453.1 hypothetical protein Y017_01395 [Alcanivorax sp. 97CO-5]PKG02879.1 alpha-E domain-containing protein [Alcanivorax sp. 97CO-6]BAP14025.1 hypothetical protein AS19_11740 [Alcanivorax sp. NBRC 101098]CAL16555.1 conserved hypothetical protein [Alcanivorax borkumensis SK2]
MLSRTASDLYWLSRDVERAENTARVLDVVWNLSLIRYAVDTQQEITAPLSITGTWDDYSARYGKVTTNNVLYFFTLDPDSPASIYSCLRQARASAHAVRGKITSEMWESVNGTWLELKEISQTGLQNYGETAFFEWVKNRSHLFRGATYGTLMRSDTFRFLRLGTFIERADNTARILDVKHREEESESDSTVDYYRWHALLRSLGGYEAFREMFSETINAERVAELLILRPEVPRSLLSCLQMLCELLPAIEGEAGLEAKRLAAVQLARLQYGDMGHILEIGLHNYLTDFLRRINELADTIQSEYLELVWN